uniref:Ig-like domain-containing protein n=1 Tax=Castor canadensis TaxID=51338 RepID=A0A8C0WIP4_CASCN
MGRGQHWGTAWAPGAVAGQVFCQLSTYSLIWGMAAVVLCTAQGKDAQFPCLESSKCHVCAGDLDHYYVVQITWKKIQDSSPQNIGTYSSKYGEKILPPYVDRLHCKILEPNSSFITIQKVTFEDEACYKCLFNVFPHGNCAVLGTPTPDCAHGSPSEE